MTNPLKTSQLLTPRASISACSFWRSDFCLGKKCTGEYVDEAGRLPANVVSIYGSSVNNLDTSLTNKKSILKSPTILPDIIPQKNIYIKPIDAHFQAIRFGTHLMHPPWLQPLHLLPFWGDVVLCDVINTSHFSNNKVGSRFTGLLRCIDSN